MLKRMELGSDEIVIRIFFIIAGVRNGLLLIFLTYRANDNLLPPILCSKIYSSPNIGTNRQATEHFRRPIDESNLNPCRR